MEERTMWSHVLDRLGGHRFLSLFLPALALLVGNVVWAQIPADDPPQPLASLKTVPVPEPAESGSVCI
jgi:hypothetical protein